MEDLSTAPEWTLVFCSLAPDQRYLVWDVATKLGYGLNDFEWYKPDLKSKSMSGGARQPMCTEHIVVVFKFSASATSHGNLDKHYTLLLRRNLLENSGTTLLVRFLLLRLIFFFPSFNVVHENILEVIFRSSR